MRIGIYGGSFDPIHTGHAIVANFVSQCGVVDEVWLMVSRRNPLKTRDAAASEDQRLAMANLVAGKCRKVSVTDIELQLPSPSYSYDTLLALKEKYPDKEFSLIIGSDSLENFSNWKNYIKIQKEFGVIVYPRPGYPLEGEEPVGMKFLTGAPEFSISSTLIREYIRDGWNYNYFVPTEVAAYIREHNLYVIKKYRNENRQ